MELIYAFKGNSLEDNESRIRNEYNKEISNFSAFSFIIFSQQESRKKIKHSVFYEDELYFVLVQKYE